MMPATDSGCSGIGDASLVEWVRRLFDRLDAKDTDGWLEFLSHDAQFCFGNAPPLVGKSEIGSGVNAFFSSLTSIDHEIAESWKLSDAVICRGRVTYTRLDGSTLTIPFANVFKLDDNGLVYEYLIYADTSDL